MRSTVIIAIVSSLVILSQAQSIPGLNGPVGCASVSGQSGPLGQQCTNCSSGFMLINMQSTCFSSTPCMPGCSICPNSTYCYAAGCASGASSKWQYNSGNGQCVDCTGATTAPTPQTYAKNCATCTVASSSTANVALCTGCAAGYMLSGGACYSCSNTTGGTVLGVSGCSACQAFSTPPTACTGGTVSSSLVQCTACQNGYALINATSTTTSGAPAVCIATPICLLLNTTNTADAGATTGNVYSTALFVSGYFSNCYNAGPQSTPWSVGLVQLYCTQPAAGYFCAGATTTSPCSTTFPSSPTAAVPSAGCTSALIVGATAQASGTFTGGTGATCFTCNSNYTLVGNACVANNNLICIAGTMITTTTCTQAAVGYSVAPTGGAPVACSSTSTSCSGGCASGSFLAPNGSCLTGTPIANCMFHNSTSFCVQCNGYPTSSSSCQACSSGCAICSSPTNCTNCSSGYTGSISGNCVSNGNTTAKSSKMLLSGLAFISVMLYYIF